VKKVSVFYIVGRRRTKVLFGFVSARIWIHKRRVLSLEINKNELLSFGILFEGLILRYYFYLPIFFNHTLKMDLFARIKKSVASVALAAMLSVFVAPAASAALPFTDASTIPSWAEEAIEELMDQGVLSGNDDGSFAPNRQLNRAEVSKIIVLASGIDFDTVGGPHFPDVEEDAWYYDYIETMYNYGWVNGYPDGMFRPGIGINRAEIAKMVINAFEIDQDLSGAPHFDDVNEGDWYYGYVETAYNNGLMRGYGDGTFGPANAVTRAETANIVYNGQLVVAEPMGPAEGTLEVVLSDDTPRGTNIPFNATSVPYLTVELTASDDSDVEISSLTFTRLGLGDNDDFDNVWLEIDGFKVGNDKSVNNDDIVELRFNPPVVVPAGQTLWADVVASAKYIDGDTNVGHHNRFALVSADDVASTAANVVGDFPIEGEEMEVADYEVSQLKFTTLGSDTTVDVGDNFIEIGKFRLLNASNTNKDVELRAVTFKNDGTAELEDSLENVALYVSGEQVSAETIVDGDYMTFRLDNGVTGGYVIEDGDSRIFSIRADIVSAEKSDSINLKIDNFEDVVGVEIGTSFGVKAVSDNSTGLDLDGVKTEDNATECTNKDAEDTCARLRAYGIDSGDLNVSRDPSSLGNQEYSPGSNDVVMLTARLVVDQPLLVDGVYINVASGSTVSNDDGIEDFNKAFDNFRLYLNDKLVDTENDFSTGAGGSGVEDFRLNFNTTFEIAGTSILKVVANVQDKAEEGDQLKLKVASGDFQSPEYISTGDQVSTTQLLGSAEGSFVQVNKSELAATETSGLSDGDKIVAGVDDVTFMEFVLDNNDSGDVNVTSVTVAVDKSENANEDGLGVSGSARTYTNFTLAIFVDGTQQGSAKNLSSDGVATFNDLSVVIPSADQKEFVVVVDTIEASASSVATTVAAGKDETALGATDDVEVASTTGMTVGDLVVFKDVRSISTTVAVQDETNLGDTADVEVADTTGIQVGDTLVFDNDGTPIIRTVTAVTDATHLGLNSDLGVNLPDDSLVTLTPLANIVKAIKKITNGTDLELDSDIGVNLPDGSIVTVKHQLKLDLTAVDADNVENGQEVTVIVDGTTDEVSTDDPVVGSLFEFVESGSLTVSPDSTVASDILIANQSNAEVLKIRFNAADDEVQVKDIYLENDLDGDGNPDELTAGDRVDFKLYNESGQLIQEKQMTNGTLHFELANQDRIRVPKDDSTYVTVKVDVRDITKANQTGKRLLLALDADGQLKGIEAVTAATGDDIDVPTTWGDAVGKDFVIYKTELSIDPASTQPSMNLPSLTSTEFYRFTVAADSADNAEIGHVTMNVALNGIDFSGVATFTTKKIENGTPNNNQEFTTRSSGDTADTDTTVQLKVDLAGERLSAGESRTYAVFMDSTDEVDDAKSSDGVTVTLLQDESYADPTNKARQSTQNVAWSDESDTAHSDTTLDWLNGYWLDIDTNGFKITRQ
jgi:hypothetical protein